MLAFMRAVYIPILSIFQFISNPFNLVLGFVSKALGAWKPSTSGLRVSDKYSSPRTQTTGVAAAASDLPIHPPHVEVIEVHPYYPPGVTKIIGRGGENFIGVIDESTVLKYPCIPGSSESLQIEAQLLEILESHPRIIQSNGLTEHGLILQYAPNGNLRDYIESNLGISLDQKLRWCKQAAEAVKYIHEKNIIHCDINLRNFLLDKDFNLLLADFQGMLKSADGETLLDGLSRECSKSFLPRIHGDYADVKTDLFALGSAIYYIMTGHEIFPQLDSFEDEDEIESRFVHGQFPADNHTCCQITEKCWKQCYESAGDIISDISQIQTPK